MWGSPSRGENGRETDCLSDETCVVIGYGTNPEPVAACLAACFACPVDVSVTVRMSDQQERLPVLHNATLLSVGSATSSSSDIHKPMVLVAVATLRCNRTRDNASATPFRSAFR